MTGAPAIRRPGSRKLHMPAPVSDNFRGAAYMTVAMAAFAVNDTIIKAFAGELALGQVILLRGMIASCLVFVLAWRLGHLRRPAVALHPLLVLRSVSETAATFFFLNALFHIPIANASAILQVLPLALTLFAALLLGEAVGWRRMTAILIGFIGVLVVVRPGMSGFSIYSIYALVAVVACVARDLSTRRLHAGIPSMFITLVASLAVTTMGAALSLFETWQPVSPRHVGLLVLSSAFLLTGYYTVISSMRVGDIGFVSPFRYAVLLFSAIGGMVFFDEYPDALTWVGAAIIVATGIYTLYREHVVLRRSRATAVPLSLRPS
ncbi:MAG: DMT family transporter [Pseudomonadota bacterium]|nr:DMT family transporter [Pseudomonadota bacterium]